MTSSKHSAQSDAVQQGENPLLVESALPTVYLILPSSPTTMCGLLLQKH